LFPSAVLAKYGSVIQSPSSGQGFAFACLKSFSIQHVPIVMELQRRPRVTLMVANNEHPASEEAKVDN